MSNCYFLTVQGTAKKMTTADVKNIAFQITGQYPRSLAQAKDVITDNPDHPLSQSVCFSFDEARAMVAFNAGFSAWSADR